MPSIFDPPDPIKRARGEVFMKRFKSPEGIEEGFIGSFVASMIEWRESGAKLSHKEFTKKAVDEAIGLSPSPTPVQIDKRVLAKSKARLQQKRRVGGRRGTILTESGLGIASIGKSVLLGGSL